MQQWQSSDETDPIYLAKLLEEIVTNHGDSWSLKVSLRYVAGFLRSLERVKVDSGGTQGASSPSAISDPPMELDSATPIEPGSAGT